MGPVWFGVDGFTVRLLDAVLYGSASDRITDHHPGAVRFVLPVEILIPEHHTLRPEALLLLLLLLPQGLL